MYLAKIKNSLPLLFVIFVGLLAGRTLFGQGYFNMHDDLQMMRQLQMEKCFIDGQIPCRWVPDMGYGFGFPLFNFYPPLPYMVGELFRVVGFSFVDTAKLLFVVAFVASGVTMYFLSKEFFGKLAGIVSAVFYIWAPYHSVDIFVRGAMNESWAFIWYPLILLFSYKLISAPSKPFRAKGGGILLLALAWFGLLTSHNLMVLIFTPLFAIWCLFWFFKSKNYVTNVLSLTISGAWAFGLAAFFTLPVFLEQKLVHTETLVQGYYEFTAHFATINQLLFSRFWGYGPSVWMENDGMSFQVGHIHWILSIFLVLLVLWKLVRSKNKSPLLHNTYYIILFFVIAGWFAAFMAHSRSTPLWTHFSPLKFVQFPWRFLALVIFCFSFAIGGIVLFIPNKIVRFVSLILIFGTVLFNWSYFLPQQGKLGPLTDQQKFSGTAWNLQRTAGILDYLPSTAKENPKDGKTSIAEIISGKGNISNLSEGTNHLEFNSSISSETATVRINTYQFPDWKTFIDGQEVKNTVPEGEKWGRMYIEIPKGEHKISARLYDTLVRKMGNILTVISWILLAIVVFKKSRSLHDKI